MSGVNKAKNRSGDETIPGWYGVDPSTTDLKPNPHAHYKHLREVQPVNLTPPGDWRLSNYVDIETLLKHSHSGVRNTDGLIPEETREETEASKFMLKSPSATWPGVLPPSRWMNRKSNGRPHYFGYPVVFQPGFSVANPSDKLFPGTPH